VLDEDAAQDEIVLEFENESNESETSTKGTNKNKAPPAALLLLGAHDTEEVIALQLLNVLFTTSKLEDSTTDGIEFEMSSG
jgi:hypothetical protein